MLSFINVVVVVVAVAGAVVVAVAGAVVVVVVSRLPTVCTMSSLIYPIPRKYKKNNGNPKKRVFATQQATNSSTPTPLNPAGARGAVSPQPRLGR